jgi:transcriptional regulator with XRE-family HTH domain
MGFGARLRSRREKAGLSQVELASRAGVPLDSIQNWEQDRTRPRLEALSKLVAALGVSTDALILGDAEEPDTPKRRPGRPPKKATEPEARPAPKRARGRKGK